MHCASTRCVLVLTDLFALATILFELLENCLSTIIRNVVMRNARTAGRMCVDGPKNSVGGEVSIAFFGVGTIPKFGVGDTTSARILSRHSLKGLGFPDLGWVGKRIASFECAAKLANWRKASNTRGHIISIVDTARSPIATALSYRKTSLPKLLFEKWVM